MLPHLILPVRFALQEWVESISVMHVDFEKQSLPSLYVYPKTVTEHLYFTIAGEPLLVQTDQQKGFMRYPQNFIVGPQLANDIVDLGRYRYVGRITFRPGGLYRLLGIPLTELTDGLDLSLILAKESRELSGKLAEAQNEHAVLTILESFLLQRINQLKPVSTFEQAVAELVNRSGNVSIKRLADWAALSIRQLERRSLAALGVTPKLYARITRFANACRYKQMNPKKTWLQVTYECGYADQMHLINDYKQFTGFNPESQEGIQALGILSVIDGRR